MTGSVGMFGQLGSRSDVAALAAVDGAAALGAAALEGAVAAAEAGAPGVELAGADVGVLAPPHAAMITRMPASAAVNRAWRDRFEALVIDAS